MTITDRAPAPDRSTPADRAPMTSLRKTALVAGVFYLLTFVSIPTLLLYQGVHEAGFITGTGSDTPVLLGARARTDRGPHRDRHGHRAVPGGQAAERGFRDGLRGIADPRGGHASSSASVAC